MIKEDIQELSRIRSLVKDIAIRYGTCLPMCAAAAMPELRALAAMAGKDVAWAIAEAVEEFDFMQDGGYL